VSVGGDDKERELPRRVITHEGVVTSKPRGKSESERGFVRWMEEHEPDDEEEDAAPEEG